MQAMTSMCTSMVHFTFQVLFGTKHNDVVAMGWFDIDKLMQLHAWCSCNLCPVGLELAMDIILCPNTTT